MAKIVKNNLGYSGELFVYQDKDMFNYSVDTILLGNFVSINRRVSNILEVGTNNAALSIFIAARSKRIKIDAIEIQEKAVQLAQKNVELNNMQEQINVICADFRKYYKDYAYLCGNKKAKKYSLIVANPPYYNENFNIKRTSSTEEQKLATHEINLNLDELISGASKIIEQKGYLTIVLPIARYNDLICTLRKYNFEPKRVQLVYPRVNDLPKFCLVESRFNSGWGTSYLKNLYLHYNDINSHEYTEEIKKLYSPIKEK
ncbi:tRNA1(Val) (adenine(37)-N6)-methyltransferase [Metamycoplasma hyosynoviae]|uniref:Lactate dehydrogenase n=1 Tax=Metamycoplasma hyosynoviae TaxID=29559 RepID=A0A063YJ51_9BACT|nr:tRNA1(Val) (adenine(37)-N6)-methyltransferase [Metamycoplasma hyosynoviae]ASI53896.1 lactate dehydrogenase [Metamycoplasma hyosynoviae]KDE45170.1 lactate dehydrogenase [Metamycoplasma hyosynoviae]MDC8901209.1 tRNA1(Val) (adenine(37)-N6)-methyltransferase [Metamycoplasma hyosynoviae]MDC8911968.1 tRNA1(Val) (adenine(37)-N6)-methyltransferase [Metamycoplasma hyosynoviae]MDC8912660.1 tRNA1(Val) (adenine(37)-N6)-methyltransferase [Metamycoplasma hyosynoviae]